MGSRKGCPNLHLNPRTAPTEHPTMLDIAWAAGIWEGEGSIAGMGTSYATCLVSVVQKDRWILDRFKSLFGGGVSERVPDAKGRFCYVWQTSGSRARGFIYTIFTYLSPRRRAQVRKHLGV